MAQKVQVLLLDDVDGGEASETVNFALDGVTYEIDLSEANATRLRDAVGPFASVARKTSGRGVRRGSTAGTDGAQPRRGGGADTKRDPAQTQAIRRWAQDNGHKVSDRGRIPATVITAYEEAH